MKTPPEELCEKECFFLCHLKARAPFNSSSGERMWADLCVSHVRQGSRQKTGRGGEGLSGEGGGGGRDVG